MKREKNKSFIIKKGYTNKKNGQKNISLPKWFGDKEDYFKITRIKKEGR